MLVPMERIGIDLGGTKIEGVILCDDGSETIRQRVATPADDYAATIETIGSLVDALRDHASDPQSPIGIGTPGSRSRRTGLMKNCNSTCLNGKPLQSDIEQRIGVSIQMANDANCLALSEWHDGAAAGAGTVFSVILGTGVGGGCVVNGTIMEGAGGIGGEWGHVPLPWPKDGERPGPPCYCGRSGCMEQWCSGPALAADHMRSTGLELSPPEIVQLAVGDSAAADTIERWLDRLARGLAVVSNIIDPDVFVIGGGLSSIQAIYEQLPDRMLQYVFSDEVAARIVPATYGDASGVRGAARLSLP